MTFQITVQPSGHQFNCEPDETVLAAALKAGIGLPYGCKNGACGSCKGKVVAGTVTHRAHQQRALSEDDEASGGALFCCATAHSDLVIEAREVNGSSDFPIKKMPSRVATLEKVTLDVAIISLQLPATERLQYRAGQYIEIMLAGGKRRSYSIANAPAAADTGTAAPDTPATPAPPITLHVRHIPGGLFTDHVFGAMKERDILRFEGPLGTFFLREESTKPMLLLASGTGFAPLKAIVEKMIQLQSPRPMVLYWGGRRPQDLYMDALCQQWQTQLPNFRYVPVISNAQESDQWQGRTGLVHNAVMADLPDLSGYQVYACGAPLMIDAAQRDFVQVCHLPPEEFLADAFTSEADLSAPI
jgi:CDP-4-dehydro-6-deoxyglucose reductase